jgi:hypothetical protein
VEQVGKRAQRIRCGGGTRGSVPGGEIGPVGGDQSACLVGKNQQKVQAAGPLPSADDLEAQPLERVAGSGDDDGFRKVVERGSLSWFPSAAFHMPN